MKTVEGLLAFGLAVVANAQYYQNVSSSVVSYETVTTDVLTTVSILLYPLSTLINSHLTWSVLPGSNNHHPGWQEVHCH